jgi:catechol 2,3-dioxygenase-like lactoylglutathione lyase family enzyme
MYPMSPIRHFDHVGITVRDLDTVTAFFVGLGFETEGRRFWRASSWTPSLHT